MAKTYYYNDNVDVHARHEIHTDDCAYLPDLANRTYIGICSSCQEAVQTAKTQHPTQTFDGCYYCCNACHKG